MTLFFPHVFDTGMEYTAHDYFLLLASFFPFTVSTEPIVVWHPRVPIILALAWADIIWKFDVMITSSSTGSMLAVFTSYDFTGWLVINYVKHPSS